MFAILGALLLRGLAPEMYEQRHDERWQRWWGRAFVAGSLATPFFLGLFTANWLLGSAALVTLPGVLVGLTVVDGVAFLRLKTRADLRADLQADGYRALAAYLVLVVATLAGVYAVAPDLRATMRSPLVLGLVGLTLVFAAAYALATRRDRYYLALVAAAGLVFSLVAWWVRAADADADAGTAD